MPRHRRERSSWNVAVVLAALLAAAGAGAAAQQSALRFDHVFVQVDDAGPVAAALAEAGFLVRPDTSRHTGQGTASISVLFDNGYLELLWVDAPAVLRAAHAMLAERMLPPGAPAPFGLGLSQDSGGGPLPFPTRPYRAAWMEEGTAIGFADTHPDEPAVFVVPAYMSFQALIRGRPPLTSVLPHGNGANAITVVRFHGPRRGHSAAFDSVLEQAVVETAAAETYWVEVQLDGARTGRTVDLRPDVPLVVRF